MIFPIRRICGVALAVLLVGGSLTAQPADQDSVLPPAAATAEDIRGPKALVEIPVPEKPPIALWAGIGGGVLLLLILAYLWRVYARRQRRKSPPELAMASLTDLEKTGEALGAEEFANRAAHTVRQYISARFGLAAPRRTTEEFLRDLAGDANSPLANESDHLRGFLKSCDLAKFAGADLNASQRGELVDAARGFARATSQATAP